MMMGVLIFFLIVPILGFICATINYFIINKFKLPEYMAYLLPSLSILFIFIHAIKLHMILFFYVSCVYSAYTYYDKKSL